MRIYKTILLCAVILIACFSCGCTSGTEDTQNEKIKVVTTLFPHYDFATAIGGDKVQVTKLLPWGAESHSYDMTVSDAIEVSCADIFVYTGENMETWAQEILDGTDNKDMLVVDLSKGIELKSISSGHSHTESSSDYDAHIWTDPDNAIIMADEILQALCERDSKNQQYYTQNAEKLKLQIKELAYELLKISESYSGETLYFGSRFAFLYLFDRYGFNYRSPYSGCAEHSEPGIKTVSEIISEMKNDKTEYIFIQEMSESKIAKSIAEETGAHMLVLHSCHNLSKDEAKEGQTYVTIMRKNIQNIKEVIGEGKQS